MIKIIILLSIFLGTLLVLNIQDSFAESEYTLSHFYSKGVFKNISGDDKAVVWTLINGDKGTVISNYLGTTSVTRLDMQSHYQCYEEENLVCMNGTITSVKNSKISEVGDVITMAYEMPHSQLIVFFDGPFAGTTLDIELSKFRAKETSKIIEQQANEIVDELKKDAYLRIIEARDLLKNELIQEKLIESNQEFYNFDDLYAEIDKRNVEWEVDKPDVSPFEASIISNKVSDILRDVMKKDSERPTKFVIKEIILTNAYGANVGQTGPTTDYKQWDEQWWQIAKQNAFDYQSGFDESVGVQSFDISVRVISEYSTFLGVIKFVINIE